jgi:hypothetical protein
VELATLGEVLSVMGLAAAALERIALRKKLGGKVLEIPVRVKIQDAGAAALARALTASAIEAVEAPPEVAASGPAPRPLSPPEVAVFSGAPTPAAGMGAVEEMDGMDAFAVSPPEEESPLGITPAPRTVRTPAAPVHEGSGHHGRRSAGVHFQDGPSRAEGHPGPTRRGQAPVFEGRGARAAPPISLEPLPATPPPNATAWTSFPSNPPPTPSLTALSLGRPRSDRPDPPIPREEIDSSRTPLSPPALEATGLHGPELGSEYQALVNRAIEGGRSGQDAFDELVRSGDLAVQAVMARFPGPLRVDRHRARAELPAASQCGPILELVVAIRRPALPFVSVRSSSPEPEIRFWATHVLGELRYPESASVLLPRLFDDDASVRRVARRSAAALVHAGPPGAPLLRGLDDIARNRDQPAPHRALAIETMGEIRAGSMVPALLAALDDASADVAESARRALMLITRQDHGLDTLRWREWWDRHGARHRIEWLIDALMHEQPSLRRAAGDELKQITKEYFGYYDDLPKRDRERAQALYRAWWDREGRGRFG